MVAMPESRRGQAASCKRAHPHMSWEWAEQYAREGHAYRRGPEQIIVFAAWSEASAPVSVAYGWGSPIHGTQYQVADFRHSPYAAAMAIARSMV